MSVSFSYLSIRHPRKQSLYCSCKYGIRGSQSSHFFDHWNKEPPPTSFIQERPCQVRHQIPGPAIAPGRVSIKGNVLQLLFFAFDKDLGSGSSLDLSMNESSLKSLKGNRTTRQRILKDFIQANLNKTRPQLEKELNNGASLFLTRITAWLRLTYAVKRLLVLCDG